MEIAINVRQLGKRYRIGREEKYRTVRQAVVEKMTQLVGRGQETRTEEIWPLRDVSFKVRRGEVMGLIGRNGAGKSTLLKVLSRITKPTVGVVQMKGRVGSLLEVGTGFHPELTGRENVFLNGAILGMRRSEIRKRFAEIHEFSEIGKFIDTPVKRYSSGMYLKLAFAVAAHFDPEILLVDEVLAVGDVAFQRKCLGKMQDVAKAGRTVVLVSHNLTAIQSLCTSCLMLHKGTLLMHDTPERCVRKYIDINAPDRPDATRTFDRPAGAPIWMTRATLFANGLPTATPTLGDEISIQIDFESSEPTQHPRIGVAFLTADGYSLLNVNNRYLPAPDLAAPTRKGSITLHFGRVPFVGRRYYLSLFLGNQLEDTHAEENAMWIDVLEKDIWGRGRVPPSTDSALWWPVKFDVQPQ